MGTPFPLARDMTMGEYDMLVEGWNLIHEGDGDEVDAPDADYVREQMERLKNSPLTR